MILIKSNIRHVSRSVFGRPCQSAFIPVLIPAFVPAFVPALLTRVPGSDNPNVALAPGFPRAVGTPGKGRVRRRVVLPGPRPGRY